MPGRARHSATASAADRPKPGTREAPRAEEFAQFLLGLRRRCGPLPRAHAKRHQFQATPGRELRIVRLQRPGCDVARVRERRLPCGRPLAVEPRGVGGGRLITTCPDLAGGWTLPLDFFRSERLRPSMKLKSRRKISPRAKARNGRRVTARHRPSFADAAKRVAGMIEGDYYLSSREGFGPTKISD